MVEIKNIDFKYKYGNEVLKNINLQIKKGECIAVVGKNGEGKSTFLKIISGLLKPNNGNVIIDGIDVYKKNNIKDIRKKVGVVFQNLDTQLLFSKVYDEIEFSLKNFNTFDLSLAQKQRINIASNLSIMPEYYILDEPTSMIDSYGKTKPYVIGDGVKTLGELIEALNLPDKNVVRENISTLDLLYVPGKNEKFEISWKHNLSGGTTPKILEKGELYDRIEQLSIMAGKAINMNFATIDIIETTDNNLYVLEVNSGIGATIFTETVEGVRDIMKDIYRYALDLLFK